MRIIEWISRGILPLTLLTSSLCVATEAAPLSRSAKNPTKQRSVTLSVSIGVPPYVIKSTVPGKPDSGFEIDIVRESLALHHLEAIFVHQPLRRSKISFKEKTVDAVMTIRGDYPEAKGAFLSDEHITYFNFAVSLASRNLTINATSDLKGKSIVGFQQASIAFGRDFKEMATNNPHYLEMANQQGQVGMLFLGRTDVIVLDRHIFKYMRARFPSQSKTQEIKIHNLFKPSSFRIAFWNKAARDSFNLGLRALKKSGRYHQIINSYFPSTRPDETFNDAPRPGQHPQKGSKADASQVRDHR
ncbi:MAG: substrate-binding periplasmic protein [Planctomycetota bacterium]|jgi:polar amino acid transport system substrate-binding protein